jgi:GNAT superfamily N-acetyltransferase
MDIIEIIVKDTHAQESRRKLIINDERGLEIGHLLFREPNTNFDNEIEIDHLFIEDGYRGRGYGILLLNKLIELFHSRYPLADRINADLDPIETKYEILKSVYANAGFIVMDYADYPGGRARLDRQCAM